MSWFLSRRRGLSGRSCAPAAVALALALAAMVAGSRGRAISPFQLVSTGGGSGGVSGQAIWSATWWNGSPQGPRPYEGPPSGAEEICIWHDLGSGLANLDGGLSEASLPLSFWQEADSGGHPGIWGVNQWALARLQGAVATDHFDVVACPNAAQVPPTGADVEADLPLASPPLGQPLHLWLFWDTVPDPPSGHLPGIIGRAFDDTQLPDPVIGASPSSVGGLADATVVNLATWLWIDGAIWRTHGALASGGGYVATVWAVPVSVTWTAAWDFPSPSDDPEGGTTFGPEVLDEVCGGPGSVYDPASAGGTTDCAFDFTQSSFGTVQPLRAAVRWSVFWALSDRKGVIGGEGSLGTVVTAATRPLRVLQIESVISKG